MSIITQLIVRHEGSVKVNGRHVPYDDATGLPLKTGDTIKGKITFMYGRNIQDVGASDDEADYSLGHDIAAISGEMQRTFPWFSQLDACRQDALLDMAFNLGLPRFKGFAYMIAAMERKDYIAAAAAMLDSKWADQVGERAKELALMVRQGTYQQ